MKDYADREDTPAITAGELSSPPGGLLSRAGDRTRGAFSYAVRHWVRSITCAAVFLALALAAGPTAAFFVTFALVMLLMGLDCRISLALFAVCITICTILLGMHDYDGAKEVAIWAYFFLATGVVAQLVALWREKRAATKAAAALE